MADFHFGNHEQQQPMVDIKERCGVLIRSSASGYVWIVAPFWDDSNPMVVNAPDREIDAVIVINTNLNGALPLTSFFAMDASLPDAVFVLSAANPHDWHSSYTDPEAINSFVRTEQLPEKMQIGELQIFYEPGTDFVQISRENGPYERLHFLAGQNLFYRQPEHPFHGRTTFWFAGSFDTEKLLDTYNAVNSDRIHTDDDLKIFLLTDWIAANPPVITDALNRLGHTVYAVGTREP